MIHWNVSPEIVNIGPLSIRWYGLLFAAAFLTGFRIIERIFSAEKVSAAHLDRLFVYVIVSTLLGARLGHTLFYEPEVYLPNPLRILKIWEGGLASHGAAVGIFFALFIYSKKYKLSWLWMVDRLAIVVALAGAFIRTGNLFNSEIIGKPTDLPWAFVFERVDSIPRHPPQIYEALGYLATFILLHRFYWKGNKGKSRGFLFGTFLIAVFGSRFVWEFFKENQVAFESSLPLNMGQLLSIPLVITGIILLVRARRSTAGK